MYYGFYDTSLSSYSKTALRPNLEIGKLYTYYKKQGHICKLAESLEDIEKYDRFFIRNDAGQKQIPSYILLKDNVDCGGLHYSNNRYVPLEPFEIEYCVPNFTIYFPFIKAKQKKDQLTPKLAKKFFNVQHTRLFAEGVYVGHIKERKNASIWVHDTFLTENEGWLDILKEHAAYTPFRIHFTNPLYFTKIDHIFDDFADSSFISWDTSCRIMKSFNSSEFKFFIKEYNKILSSEKKFYFPLGFKNLSSYSLFNIRVNVLNVLNQIFFARSKKIKLKLFVYDTNITPEYVSFFLQLRNWVNYSQNNQFSFFEFLKDKGAVSASLTAERIIENSPKLSKMLNKSLYDVEKGGFWVYE